MTKENNVAFPLIRRVMPSKIAADLVSVQPMSTPSALLFYLDNLKPTISVATINILLNKEV